MTDPVLELFRLVQWAETDKTSAHAAMRLLSIGPRNEHQRTVCLRVLRSAATGDGTLAVNAAAFLAELELKELAS